MHSGCTFPNVKKRDKFSASESQHNWPVTSKYYETPTHAIRKSFHAKGSTELTCPVTLPIAQWVWSTRTVAVKSLVSLLRLASCAAAACHFHIVRCHWVYRPALTWINISKEWALQVTFDLHKDPESDRDRFLHFSDLDFFVISSFTTITPG